MSLFFLLKHHNHQCNSCHAAIYDDFEVDLDTDKCTICQRDICFHCSWSLKDLNEHYYNDGPAPDTMICDSCRKKEKKSKNSLC
jgi:hypothetical protein